MFCKLKLPHLLMGLLLTALPSSAFAFHLGGESGHPAPGNRPAEDIANTLHNLGDSVTGPTDLVNFDATTDNPGEVCVFCHTPHGGNSSAIAVQGAPLWNRSVNAAGGYTIYNGANFDGVNSGQPQGVSLACLSCHDGTFALDALINQPGSGGFSGTLNTGSNATALLQAQGGSDFLLNGVVAGAMSQNIRTDTGPNYGPIQGGAVPFPNLTQDLGDDHPISMEIPAADPQFDEIELNSSTVTAAGLRLLTRTGIDHADLRDQLRAYPDPTGGALTDGIGYVECASCHNPHAPRPLFLRLPNDPAGVISMASGGGATTVDNLTGNGDTTRVADNPNAASLVCRSCHAK